ncbi:MAG TPA: 4-alpha-glucanotransferase, partial [Tepidisphaeraceae bacterium]|nr:4-alpha-glucanotransferase [Tepidisphaeraceae bacterium]
VPGVEKDPARSLIRLAWESVAELAIAPAQDVLGLGSEARMNVPGSANGNWNWRLREAPSLKHAEELRSLTELYGRAG